MKHGQNPTRKQKVLLKQHGKNPDNWLVTKNPPGELHIMHRHTGTEETLIMKGAC